jgi:hypothetical protein
MRTTTKRTGNSIHRSIATNASWSRSGTLPKSIKIKERQRKERLRKKWWFKLLNKIFNIKF